MWKAIVLRDDGKYRHVRYFSDEDAAARTYDPRAKTMRRAGEVSQPTFNFLPVSFVWAGLSCVKRAKRELHDHCFGGLCDMHPFLI